MIKIDPTLVFWITGSPRKHDQDRHYFSILDFRESQKTWDPRERKGQTRIGFEIDPYKS